jgi:hypothetical protein
VKRAAWYRVLEDNFPTVHLFQIFKSSLQIKILLVLFAICGLRQLNIYIFFVNFIEFEYTSFSFLFIQKNRSESTVIL